MSDTAMRRAPLISRSVLSDQVKERLLQAILTGHYLPGSRIVETRVARDLGISQGPVREALRDLEALGVVEITPFQGARVRHPGKTELLEAYGIRAELESLGARLALARISNADLDELQTFVDEMERAAIRGDTHGEASIDAAFHARVIELAGNRTLDRVWHYLEPVSRTYITLGVPGIDLRQIAGLHPPILDALRLRDPERTVEAIRRHFLVAGALFDRLVADDEAPFALAPAGVATAPSGA